MGQILPMEAAERGWGSCPPTSAVCPSRTTLFETPPTGDWATVANGAASVLGLRSFSLCASWFDPGSDRGGRCPYRTSRPGLCMVDVAWSP